MSAGTVTINNVCYKAPSGDDALKATGDVALMGMSMIGILLNCVCVLLFGYLMTTSESLLIKVMVACCASSLVSSIYKYWTAKSDLDTIKSKMTPC